MKTKFKLTKDTEVVVTTCLDIVKLLRKRGWKVQLSRLGELI